MKSNQISPLPCFLPENLFAGYAPIQILSVTPDFSKLKSARLLKKLNMLLELIADMQQPPFPQLSGQGTRWKWNGFGEAGYQLWLEQLNNGSSWNLSNRRRSREWQAGRIDLIHTLRIASGNSRMKYQRCLANAAYEFEKEADKLATLGKLMVVPKFNLLSELHESLDYFRCGRRHIKLATLALINSPQLNALLEYKDIQANTIQFNEIVYAARSGTPILRRLAAIKLQQIDSKTAITSLRELLFDSNINVQSAAAYGLLKLDIETLYNILMRMQQSDFNVNNSLAKLYLRVIRQEY